MELKKIIDESKEFTFKFDKNKSRYLDSLFVNFRTNEEDILKSDNVKYDISISTPDNGDLYFNGYEGKILKGCHGNGVSPFTCFVQDLISIKNILKMYDDCEIKRFERNLFNYVSQLINKNLICPPKVPMKGVNEQTVKKAITEINYAYADWTYLYILETENKFKALLEPKIKKIGDYNPNKIKNNISLYIS